MIMQRLITNNLKDAFKSYFADVKDIKITFKQCKMYNFDDFVYAIVEYNLPANINSLTGNDFDKALIQHSKQKKYINARLNDFIDIQNNTKR